MKKYSGDELIKKMETLRNYEGEDRVVDSFTLIDKIEEERKKYPDFKVMSGIPYLDKLIDGFEGGELITLSGMPKSGKSLLAQTLLSNFFKYQNQTTLYFSYELTNRAFVDRFPVDSNLYYMPIAYRPNSLEWVYEKILECKIKNNTRIVMIDHAHYLFDLARSNNVSVQLGSVIRELKQMAITYNLVIFLLAHMAKVKRGEEETGGDIRDSSFFLAESDTILIMKRIPDDKENISRVDLLVDRTRRTGVLYKSVKLHKANGLLCELEAWRDEDRA